MHQSDPWIQGLPLGPGVKLIKADRNGLCALDKPAGILSHPNKGGDRRRSLFQLGFDPGEETFICSSDGEGESRRIWLLNRLDSATSGLILVALDQDVAEEVRRAFRERQVTKVYQALVFGHARTRQERWQDRMGIKGGQGSVRAESSGPLQAVTEMRRLRLLPGPPAMSLLELIPKTGRTHQLRFQGGRRRMPIVGDQTYGNFQANRDFARRTGNKRLFLHAQSIQLDYTFRGRRQSFKARSPLPPDFRAVLPR